MSDESSSSEYEIIEGSSDEEEILTENEVSSGDSASGDESDSPTTKDYYQDNLSDSEDDGIRNQIGNIPLEWYDDHDHMGYDKDGNKLLRPPKPDMVQQFLDLQTGKGLRTVWDDLHSESVEFSKDQMEVVKNISAMKFPHTSFDAFPEYDDFFSKHKLVMPIKAAPPSKASFTASKDQAKMILRYLKAIKRGELHLLKPKTHSTNYLLWDDSGKVIGDVNRRSQYIPPPKPKPPSHIESYNPPEEFIPTQEELNQWAMMDPEQRPVNFVPRKYSSLRSVPYYQPFVEERFERCMDLYLCPRTYRKKVVENPDDLLPKLPAPRDLRPYPTRSLVSVVIESKGLKSIDNHVDGLYMAVGDSDGKVSILEVFTGRVVLSFGFVSSNVRLDSAVTAVSWIPVSNRYTLGVTIDDVAFVVELNLVLFRKVEGFEEFDLIEGTKAQWSKSKSSVVVDQQFKKEMIVDVIKIVHHPSLPLDRFVWHKNGDYFATLAGSSSPQSSLLIHRLSKSKSVSPVKNARIIDVAFHPSRPWVFFASSSQIRALDLQQNTSVKKLSPGSNALTSIAVHPSGDHLIVSTNDKQVIWFDLDLGEHPFKKISYHKRVSKLSLSIKSSHCLLLAQQMVISTCYMEKSLKVLMRMLLLFP
ncbi:hypothetical protein GEMRC1_013711 [Eukaryota sp. GEM-RC1]